MLCEKPKRLSLTTYLVDVRRRPDGEIEQYLIDGRSRILAIRAAAKYAGVTPDRVLNASRYSPARSPSAA